MLTPKSNETVMRDDCYVAVVGVEGNGDGGGGFGGADMMMMMHRFAQMMTRLNTAKGRASMWPVKAC